MVVENVTIDQESVKIIERSLLELKAHFDKNIYNLIAGEIAYLFHLNGNEVSEFLEHLTLIIQMLGRIDPQISESSVPASAAPYLKRAVLFYRKKEAKFIDEQKVKSPSSDLSQKLDNYLLPIERILQSEWLKDVAPAQLPRIADFLSIEIIDKFLSETEKMDEREYDEKFHILQSPKLFLQDLDHFRNVCEIRGCSIAVAYLDIDDFKKLNTKHTEVEIDRKVLPRFMQTLEAFVFNHGFAYRYGGDEYIVILVNVTKEAAIHLLDSLRLKIKELKYPEVEETTTISIGFCLVEPDCYLTNREIEKKANEAKNFAKNNGKDCIATYNEKDYGSQSLCLSNR